MYLLEDSSTKSMLESNIHLLKRPVTVIGDVELSLASGSYDTVFSLDTVFSFLGGLRYQEYEFGE